MNKPESNIAWMYDDRAPDTSLYNRKHLAKKYENMQYVENDQSGFYNK